MAAIDKKVRGTPTTVEEALDRFWKCKGIPGNVPDYYGFTSWVSEKMEAGRSAPVPLHMQTEVAPEIRLIGELVRAAENAGIEFTPGGAVPQRDKFGRSDGRRPRLKSFNRAKLLLSFFIKLPERQRHLHFSISRAWQNIGDDMNVRQDSSQFEHRVAFFDAVKVGDGHLAFKMLGRLREEEHDPGELEFLEATAYFQQNRLSEAIQHEK
jgi:hypothetical protein